MLKIAGRAFRENRDLRNVITAGERHTSLTCAHCDDQIPSTTVGRRLCCRLLTCALVGPPLLLRSSHRLRTGQILFYKGLSSSCKKQQYATSSRASPRARSSSESCKARTRQARAHTAPPFAARPLPGTVVRIVVHPTPTPLISPWLSTRAGSNLLVTAAYAPRRKLSVHIRLAGDAESAVGVSRSILTSGSTCDRWWAARALAIRA